jgi:crotonobetainyl-CoA:carnitine CoA-transferase CaiB-like acyl-CoA transferase
MERLGLSFQALREANPGLVMVSVTNFGQDGPYKDYQSTELILHALSGEMYLAGDPDKPPLMKGGHMA